MARPIILVGTDFSESARAALQAARQLAWRVDGEVAVLHVCDPRENFGCRLDEDAERWVAEEGLDASCFFLRKGLAWVELTREARGLNAAFLVVGRHGRSGVQPIELGSHAARVALAAPCPVLLVGEHVPGRSHPEFWRPALGAAPSFRSSIAGT